MLLQLAEAGAVQFLASRQVLEEMEDVLRRKAPASLGALALLLDTCRVEIVSPPDTQALELAGQWIAHPGDRAILASALWAEPDYFVTLDKKHFLRDDELRDVLPFPIGTPGDCLAWYRTKLQDQLPK